MTTFLIEAVVLCLLFHLVIWRQAGKEPAKRIYSYPPAIVERYIELGRIPDKKNPGTLERVKKKWPAAIVIGILLGAIVYFVNGSQSFLNGFLVSYGLWLIVDWYDAIVLDILWFCHSKIWILPGTEARPGPKVDDINTMHRYRDAIVYENPESRFTFEKTMFGAYILFPYADEEEYKDHRFYKSIETVNIRGLPFLPSATSLVTDLLEELVSDSPESAFERASLPAGIEERLKSVDWDKREVLIGFVPDDMHRKLFLNNRMYFTRRFDTTNLPVRYVALYEKGTGIGWYGEVVGWEHTPRRMLPGRSSHGKDKYHVFRVLKWHTFETPISVSEYGPNPIAYTNYFLLSNSSTYSELLLKSEADYRFFTELKRRTDEAVIEQSDEATAFEFGSAKVLFDRSNICVFVGDKQVDMCTVQEFSKHPNATFRRLQKYAELMITS